MKNNFKIQMVRNFGRGILPAAYPLLAAGILLASIGSSAKADDPLATITEPRPNHTYQTPTVRMSLHFGSGADAGSFHAELNGMDFTSSFNPQGGCTGSGGCDKTAYVPSIALRHGDNVLTVDVGGPNQSVGTARAKFRFQSGASLAGDAVERLVPAVAVKSVDLVKWDDNLGKNVNEFQIVVGPGAGYPKKVYNAAGLNCSAGINSVQVLVLERGTLKPVNIPGDVGSRPGEKCFGDAGSLASFLQSLSNGHTGALVVAHSFTGMMPNLDTTAIGGTKFGASEQHDYSIIGVVGAPAGTAYESYEPEYYGEIPWALNPLVGSLMLDTQQNYYFVSSAYREVGVIPNDPAFAPNTTSTVTWSNHNPSSFHGTLPAGTHGGFFAVVFDRGVGYLKGQSVFATNTGDASKDYAAIDALGQYLQRWSKQDIIFLTTIGTPFTTATPKMQPVFNAINALGGNAYVLQSMHQAVNGKTPYYTFISVADPKYVDAGYVVESSSLTESDKASSTLTGLLARDRKNRWVMRDQIAILPNATAETMWPWEKVGFQPPQDWPAWTTGQQFAYNDLINYTDVRNPLGCGGPNDVCQPIRTYYDSGIGGSGSGSNVTNINYPGLQYKPNPNYTEADFNAVKSQLAIEAGYLKNVYILYGMFQAVTDQAKENIDVELSKVAQNIDSSVKSGDSTILVDYLTKASTVTGVLSVVPAAGTAMGAMSAILNAAVVLTPGSSGVPDGGFSIKLNDLIQKQRTFGTTTAKSVNTLFVAIMNDWGKLQTIGGGYGSQRAPWYMCYECKGSNVPQSAIPFVALGAKRRFYKQLLPTKYSLDLWLGLSQSQPSQVKKSYFAPDPDGGQTKCISQYASAPPAAWTTYKDIPYPNSNDIYVMTQTYKEGHSYPYSYNNLYFPSQGLLSDLFDKPDLDANGLLIGGAGFERFSVFRTNGGILAPRDADYQPNCNF